MRVLHVEPKRYDAEARLRLQSAVEIDFRECQHQAEFLSTIVGTRYQALFTRLGLACDKTVFEAAPRLRYVVTPTTGTDHIDVYEAALRNIQIISLHGETALLDSVTSTAEHTWSLLLAASRHLLSAHQDVLAERWRREPFIARELAGRTLGIVGCGRLGRMVAGYGLAFGMRVLAYDLDEEQLAAAPLGTEAASLTKLLADSDFVTLHLPLRSATVGFINRETLSRMRPDAVLINTARGELIDESALLSALERGTLGAAALDVLASDVSWDGNVPTRHPLVQFARESPRLILSPHIGGYGRDALRRTRRFIVEKFLSALASDSEAEA